MIRANLKIGRFKGSLGLLSTGFNVVFDGFKVVFRRFLGWFPRALWMGLSESDFKGWQVVWMGFVWFRW